MKNQDLFTLCLEHGFTRKRTDSSRLAVIEQCLSISGHANLDAAKKLPIMLEMVEASKAAVKKVASKKLPANHTAGQTHRDELPALAAGTYLITGAQNNTNVNQEFFTHLLDLTDQLAAELITIPIWYNKAAYDKTAESEGEKFDPILAPFLRVNDFCIGDESAAIVYANAGINPTQLMPRNAAQHFNTGECLSIVASPKQQMLTLPRLNNEPIRFAWSTACCTQINYTRSAAGKKAQIDHSYGALLVTVTEDGQADCTNIKFEQGSLNVFYNDEIYSTSTTPLERPAVSLGDLHCECMDFENWNETLRYLEELAPSQLVCHDVLHFSKNNHHNLGDDFHKYLTRNDTVAHALNQVTNLINELSDIAPVYLVESNHNSAIDQWLTNKQYDASLPADAKLYSLLKFFMYEALDESENKQLALEIALTDQRFNELFSGLEPLAQNINFGRCDDPFMLFGYDCSQHGHKGNNGSQGNVNQLSRLRLKMVTGHTHSGSLIGNLATGGCKALNQGYNRGGASSWSLHDVIIWPNGTTQMYNIKPSYWK